jgi:uncharacterized protein (DUF4415 family)
MKREYDFSKARRGPVVAVPKGKTRITIRLDDEILAWFRDQVERAGGGNYQSSSTRCCDSMYSKLVNLLRKSFDA